MIPSNFLKIDSLNEKWCIKDIVMLHACFQLFTECIEKENLLNGPTDWNMNDESKKARVEISELYEWWKSRKEKPGKNGLDDLDDVQYHEDNSMLIRLIGIRKYLWT